MESSDTLLNIARRGWMFQEARAEARQLSQGVAPMRAPRLGGNSAIFFMFFGVSAADAVWSHNWIRALLWFAFGSMFLLADMKETHN